MNTGSLDSHPQFYYTTRDGARLGNSHRQKGHRLLPGRVRRGGLLLGKCYWRSQLGTGWGPQPRGRRQPRDLPHVSGTVTLTLDGLRGCPWWRGERYLAG